uniref:Organ-specific protein P4-like n=1 Tax=Nicotiana sylvestris TaxID=4096 RepID=A0A1U7WVB4_NICSY|nr:PREDICTED: organ-specific protein P4-like [Nicotiana sylvestris]
MKLLVALILLFSLALYTSSTYAIKDPGEYWRAMMKDEPMPEAIKHLMPRHSVPLSKEKTDCYTSFSVGDEAFEPRPNYLSTTTTPSWKKLRNHYYLRKISCQGLVQLVIMI